MMVKLFASFFLLFSQILAASVGGLTGKKIPKALRDYPIQIFSVSHCDGRKKDAETMHFESIDGEQIIGKPGKKRAKRKKTTIRQCSGTRIGRQEINVAAHCLKPGRDIYVAKSQDIFKAFSIGFSASEISKMKNSPANLSLPRSRDCTDAMITLKKLEELGLVEKVTPDNIFVHPEYKKMWRDELPMTPIKVAYDVGVLRLKGELINNFPTARIGSYEQLQGKKAMAVGLGLNSCSGKRDDGTIGKIPSGDIPRHKRTIGKGAIPLTIATENQNKQTLEESAAKNTLKVQKEEFKRYHSMDAASGFASYIVDGDVFTCDGDSGMGYFYTDPTTKQVHLVGSHTSMGKIELEKGKTKPWYAYGPRLDSTYACEVYAMAGLNIGACPEALRPRPRKQKPSPTHKTESRPKES